MKTEAQAVVIGSGFAGAVTACRLAQAGVDVCVLERGRRYESVDFPSVPLEQRRDKAAGAPDAASYESPPDFARWLWSIDQGLWDVRDLGEVLSVQAAGYGGGSLVYANVHLRAPAEVLADWPAPYHRAALDPYYDLAAFMLDVQPFPQDRYQLAKTDRLREIPNAKSFLPPLAVNFGAPKENVAHKRVGTCDLRGYCCLGCGEHAKNTLDLNYLALAESPQQGTAATIITLAEVERIKTTEDKAHPFAVTYHDHLTHEQRTIKAQHVFLCAGAVNTTQLLLANELPKQEEPAPAGASAAGTGYFANGDALAVVFDCDRPQEVDRGPTITSSLLYETSGEWFLVQDGGVPEELDAILGVFRSPLLLYRNRYLEGRTEQAPPSPTGPPPPGAAKKKKGALKAVDAAATYFRSYQRARPGGARELIAMLPPNSAEPVRGMFGLKWPSWLKRALRDRRELLLEQIASAAEPLAQQMLDHFAELLEPRLLEFAAISPQGKKLLQDAANLGIARGLLSLGAQLMWGSESDVVRRALAFLVRTPRSLDDIVRGIGPLLRWCADYRPREGRTALLLTMGRDAARTLQWNADADQRLLATSHDVPAHRRLGMAQELAFRDIARHWGGELRTSPASTFGDRQITVHSQGGAGMRTGGAGTTDEWGEVVGCPGLYVMDAAAFPSPVGVNPSATIAAVAERKIEHFIRTRRELPNWQAPERGAALDEWLGRAQEWLDPLRHAQPTAKDPSPPAPSRPIGLTFKERMDGHFADVLPGKITVREMQERIQKANPPITKWLRSIEDAETRGIRWTEEKAQVAKEEIPKSAHIELAANATIEDLTAFLEGQYSGKSRAHLIKLDGCVLIEGQKVDFTDGTLELFRSIGGTRGRLLKYEVPFDYGAKHYHLYGLKVIVDDPRLDVWKDTSTMYFGIAGADGKERYQGVMRLPAKTFLDEQIRSFRVEGTTDDERRMWALTSFFVFFFGELAKAYLPELRRIPAILKNMLTHTHG